jgi:DNA-binding transcriptional regulator YiaG
MKSFKDRLKRIDVLEPVHIPKLDGSGIAETIAVKVPAWRDPKDGDVFLDTEAIAILDKVKARHMGLLTPDQIKALRMRLGLTQPQISELLQIGEKTWTRWETGRDRPSRSINVLLFALNDGKLDAAYLRSVARRRNDWTSQCTAMSGAPRNPWLSAVRQIWQGWEPEAGIELAQAIQTAVAGLLASRGRPGDSRFPMPTQITFVSAAPAHAIAASRMTPVTPSNHTTPPPEPGRPTTPRFSVPDEALVA